MSNAAGEDKDHGGHTHGWDGQRRLTALPEGSDSKGGRGPASPSSAQVRLISGP